MFKSFRGDAVIEPGLAEPVMAQDHMRILSDWGEVAADLVDNQAARSLGCCCSPSN